MYAPPIVTIGDTLHVGCVQVRVGGWLALYRPTPTINLPPTPATPFTPCLGPLGGWQRLVLATRHVPKSPFRQFVRPPSSITLVGNDFLSVCPGRVCVCMGGGSSSSSKGQKTLQ